MPDPAPGHLRAQYNIFRSNSNTKLKGEEERYYIQSIVVIKFAGYFNIFASLFNVTMTNLQSFLTERLMLAAQEIFKAVEVTFTEYHDEISRSRQENELLKTRLLEAGIPVYPGESALLTLTSFQAAHWVPYASGSLQNGVMITI